MRHHDSEQMQLSGKNRKITRLAKYSKHDTAGEMYPWLRVTQHLYFIITYWCVWFRLLDNTVKQFNLSWRKASEHLRYTYRNTKIKQGKFCLRYHFRIKDKYSNWNCYSVDYFIEKLNIFTWLNSCSIYDSCSVERLRELCTHDINNFSDFFSGAKQHFCFRLP